MVSLFASSAVDLICMLLKKIKMHRTFLSAVLTNIVLLLQFRGPKTKILNFYHVMFSWVKVQNRTQCDFFSFFLKV